MHPTYCALHLPQPTRYNRAPPHSRQGSPMSGLELIAAVLGVTAVWLTVKQNTWCWPIGLVMVLIYGCSTR